MRLHVRVIPVCSVDVPAVSGVVSVLIGVVSVRKYCVDAILPYRNNTDQYRYNTDHGRNINGANRNNTNMQTQAATSRNKY